MGKFKKGDKLWFKPDRDYFIEILDVIDYNTKYVYVMYDKYGNKKEENRVYCDMLDDYADKIQEFHWITKEPECTCSGFELLNGPHKCGRKKK